ncbi:MAG: GTPase ObgE, partial [Planctomycetes bacterium]|nr:GTPase ObgE [Planctomycetota bacterium]
MFKDEADITVISGKGGDGCLSFRHEAFAPRGGPDGGDGGRGGDVVFVADRHTTSLLELVRLRTIKARAGEHGRGKNCSGKSADNVRVPVPVGTMFYDRESGEQLADLSKEGQEYLAVYGGRGGRGNQHFATATHQAPQEFERGQPEQKKQLRLELKLIAD